MVDCTDDILHMIAAHSGCKVAKIDCADILMSTGMDGDDASEFFEGFGETFGVEMTGLCDYLHYNGNEPPTFRTAFGVDPTGQKMPYIPIALSDLVEAADAKRWMMSYPDHRLVQRRVPREFLLVGVAVAVIVILGLVR